MSSLSINQISQLGLCVGAGLTVVPAVSTFLIASSKIIIINVIANSILRVLSLNTMRIRIHGVSLIQVPLLWKLSKYSAIGGGAIMTVSLSAFIVNALYKRYCSSKEKESH